MDFEFEGIKYYVHTYYKEPFKKANFVYLKDGDLVFVDYIGQDLLQTISLFKILNRPKYVNRCHIS